VFHLRGDWSRPKGELGGLGLGGVRAESTVTTILDFYRQHDISPVTQNVSDLSAHFQRRAFLYRSLGLPPGAITGKSVLEVGPGSGENALYTLSLQPSRYVLVEPNAKAREALSERIGGPVVEVRSETLDEWQTDDAFDVVICEGLLGLCGRDPRALLASLVGRVARGGVLVITCIDAISDCSEVLRRASAQRYINKGASLADNVELLKPVFAPHLATLKGMTRSVEDWILDNILNPASIGPTFSIPNACTALEGRAEVLGCSPRFLLDWRWYKDGQPGNQWAIDCYWRNCHNLYDYRDVFPERDPEHNRVLMAYCEGVRADVRAYEEGASPSLSLDTDIDPAWFGRGQQYLSFVRTA
jgi:SAM-dependent methyltransferase